MSSHVGLFPQEEIWLFTLSKKISKFLRGKLRVWNVDVFGFLNLKEEEPIKELNVLDFVMVGDDPVDIEELVCNQSFVSSKV